jgi:hypothetical protein
MRAAAQRAPRTFGHKCSRNKRVRTRRQHIWLAIKTHAKQTNIRESVRQRARAHENQPFTVSDAFCQGDGDDVPSPSASSSLRPTPRRPEERCCCCWPLERDCVGACVATCLVAACAALRCAAAMATGCDCSSDTTSGALASCSGVLLVCDDSANAGCARQACKLAAALGAKSVAV